MAQLMTEDDIRKEMERCKSDYNYFRLTYLPVLDRENPLKKVKFKLREAQKRVLRSFAQNGATVVLKYRRAGVSRAILSRLFHRVHFNAGLAALTVVHTDDDARELFKQIREWHIGLPEWMRQGPFALKEDRSDSIYYNHGGMYRVCSAKAAPAGGATWWYRHYSEVSKYEDAARIVRIVEGGSATNGRTVFESTSEGLGEFFEMWKNENGMEKVFLPWTLDEEYSMTEAQAQRLGYDPEALRMPDVRKYGKEHGLTAAQERWVGYKLITVAKYNPNDPDKAWREFNREFPITAELAFLTARGRVFNLHFPQAKPRRGYIQYMDVNPYGLYALGSDAAGGNEDGDFCAFYVIDWTNKLFPRTAATFYEKWDTPKYAERVWQELQKWNALYIGERDPWGQDVQNRLLEAGAVNFWREVYKDKTTGEVAERLGRVASSNSVSELTSLLIEFLNGQKMKPVDERLQYEMNDFQWITPKKAEAVRPNHDDMLRACALAIKGEEQLHLIEESSRVRRPVGLQERFAHAQRYGNDDSRVYEPDELDDLLGGGTGMKSMMDMCREG